MTSETYLPSSCTKFQSLHIKQALRIRTPKTSPQMACQKLLRTGRNSYNKTTSVAPLSNIPQGIRILYFQLGTDLPTPSPALSSITDLLQVYILPFNHQTSSVLRFLKK